MDNNILKKRVLNLSIPERAKLARTLINSLNNPSNFFSEAKVFGIGFHKTATSSLAGALRYLGYSVTGPNGVWDPDIAENVNSMAFDLVEEYDAFQDNPWPILYKQLDEKYPGSKFILTVRPTGKWIDSVLRHFDDTPSPMREWIYGHGSPRGNEDIYIERYKNHNQEVVNYFKDRPDDLLVLKITEGEGWDKLCPFLGKDIPGIPFPHANDASSREKKTFHNVFSNIKKKMNRLMPS